MKRAVPNPTKTGPKVWSQENPRDQARVILQAIEGYILIADDVATTVSIGKILPRVLDRISELKQILEQMPPGQWEE